MQGASPYIYIKKKEGRGKEKGKHDGTACTHLLSSLILKKRQHWERVSHWFDLKGKEGTQEKLGKKEKHNVISKENKVYLFVWIKECLPKHLYLTRTEETQS